MAEAGCAAGESCGAQPAVIGYRRRPTTPATETEPAKGPFYDEIDPEKPPVIREVLERIANGEPAWAVADWLTSIDFPNG